MIETLYTIDDLAEMTGQSRRTIEREKRAIGEWFNCTAGEALAAVGAASSEHVRAEWLRWNEEQRKVVQW